MAEIIGQSNLGQPAAAAVKKSLKTAGSIPFVDIFFKTLRRWPWILASVVFCVSAMYIYQERIPTTYTRAAEILVKDEVGASIGMAEFANMGMFQVGSNLQNEVLMLKSLDLMTEVAKRLNLDVNYYRQGRFRRDVAYGFDLPIRVELPGLPEEGSASMTVNVEKDGSVLISNLRSPGVTAEGRVFKGRVGSAMNTPIGVVKVLPSKSFIGNQEVELQVEKVPMSAAAASFCGRFDACVNVDRSSVLRMTITDQSESRADSVLTKVLEVYNENWIKDKNVVARSTSNFINERLGVIEEELGNVENSISDYKSANRILGADANSGMYFNKSVASAEGIIQLNNQLQMARYVRQYIAADANKYELLPVNTGLSGGGIEGLLSGYNSTMMKRNALVAKSSESNPLVVDMDQQLAAQREIMLRSIDNLIITLNTQLRTLQDAESRANSSLATSPRQSKHLLEIERQQKVKESLYMFLLQKREENELSQAFTAYNTRIVNKPGTAGIPPSPDRGSAVMMAFLIGLMLPFGVTFVLEMLNTTVRGRKDIEGLSAPFLGEIPMTRATMRKSGFGKVEHVKAIVVQSGKRDVVNEAFRVLRTNLEFVKINKNCADVIAITSFNPGSGKSFLTMNLAWSLALKGSKVLVIDGDMRHGSSSAYVGSPDNGLSNLLNGEIADYSSVVVADKQNPNLCVLPVGKVPPNPTELLAAGRYAEMIEKFRSEYDYILIDCPPIEVVADAQIIDRYADRTIFVVRAGLFQRAMLEQIEKIYDEKKYKNMAIILNGTGTSESRYGYRHSYRYGYGYGYAYGYTYGNEEKRGKSRSWKVD